MPVTDLDPRTALVLVDLQRGLAPAPWAHPFDGVLAVARTLVDRFREQGQPIVFVRVDHAPDGATVLRPRVERELPAPPPGPDFAELMPELGAGAADIVVTKHGWDAFHGTDLDIHLRRRGVEGIVLGGVATSIGVESTARAAAERGYDLAFASDAMSDPVAANHEHSLAAVLPLIGETATAREIAALVPARR